MPQWPSKYLRFVLEDLGYPCDGPTALYEDNASAIEMVNAEKPTPCSRHIDIQHFAIQEWRKCNEIILQAIPGTANPADDWTKPLGWVLQDNTGEELGKIGTMVHFTTWHKRLEVKARYIYGANYEHLELFFEQKWEGNGVDVIDVCVCASDWLQFV